MIFWLLLGLCIALAIYFAVAPLLRRQTAQPEQDRRQILYRQQVTEIETEQAQGIIKADEATALRIEAQRRLLSLTPLKQQATDLGGSRIIPALALAGMILIGSVSLYLMLGSPLVPSTKLDQTAVTSSVPQQSPLTASDPDQEIDALIAKLVERLAQTPDEVEGWRLLAAAQFDRGRYKEAVTAYEKALALDPAHAASHSAFGEALVMIAGGVVTEQADAVFDTTLGIDSEDARAKFFKGLGLDQAGDANAALDLWIEMVNTAPVGADWVDEVRQRIHQRAAQVDIDISDRLKVVTPPDPSVAPNPSAAQIEAATKMSQADREVMIKGMVASLAAKLEQNPDDPEGWSRLIRSLHVLGETADASAALVKAVDIFASEPEVQAHLIKQADIIGVRLKRGSE